MKLTRRPDGWWIVDCPEGIDECGPYATKAEAESDMRGVQRFLKYGDRRGFVTASPPQPKKESTDARPS